MLFTMYDIQLKSYSPLLTFKTVECAIDFFANAIAFGKDDVIKRIPDNFTLYHVGDFDDELCILTPSEPHIVASGLQLLQRAQTLYRNYRNSLDLIQEPEKGNDNVTGQQVTSDLQDSVDCRNCD